MRILVTGGCGFIGSNFIRLLLRERPDWKIFNLDALTYAGNRENLADFATDKRLVFVPGSIANTLCVSGLMHDGFDVVVNFAAESHVDRSIQGVLPFVETNVMGTANIIDAIMKSGRPRLVHISTDEVYGSLPPEGRFIESTPIHPNNPYAATKASADHLVLAAVHTWGLDAVITRSSNNYGPYQYPEKFIPLFVSNALEGKDCPLYGDGMQIRDWLHVEDNCRGILAVLEKGEKGQVYNLGGGNELANRVVARRIIEHLGLSQDLIKFVKDRPGHDLRYAIDSTKVRVQLGWKPVVPFESGLADTVKWYRDNAAGWVARIKNGSFREYYEKQYGGKK